jgi:hypothetical protein
MLRATDLGWEVGRPPRDEWDGLRHYLQELSVLVATSRRPPTHRPGFSR